MHMEYMASVMHVDTCYSVPIEVVADGRPDEVRGQRMYLSTLGLRGSSGAPKLAPTPETKTRTSDTVLRTDTTLRRLVLLR